MHSKKYCKNWWCKSPGNEQTNITRYLGLGMRYEAGICTIVISMNGACQLCPFCCRLNFDPKS